MFNFSNFLRYAMRLLLALLVTKTICLPLFRSFSNTDRAPGIRSSPDHSTPSQSKRGGLRFRQLQRTRLTVNAGQGKKRKEPTKEESLVAVHQLG